MKTAFYVSSLLLFSSPLALGASLSLQCSNGQITTDIQIENGETCEGTLTYTVNGNTSEATLPRDDNSPIELEPTDEVQANASLSCNDGAISLSDSISSTQGCSGEGDDDNTGDDGAGGGGNDDDAGDDDDTGAGGVDGADENTQTVRITLTNLTRGSYFTPLAAVVHKPDIYLFRSGEEASEGLQAMAEGGDIEPLLSSLPEEALQPETPLSAELLGPGQTTSGETTFSIPRDSDETYRLSITGMILPSNDGFVGLDSLRIPSQPGTHVVLLNAYDAGTEGNDERNTGEDAGVPGNPGFPVPPPVAEFVGEGGTGFELTPEGFVHIHRGVLGDTDPTGGSSDIDSRYHRWLNPVARIIIVVE